MKCPQCSVENEEYAVNCISCHCALRNPIGPGMQDSHSENNLLGQADRQDKSIGKIESTLLILKGCFNILLKDPELLLFPFFAGVCVISVFFLWGLSSQWHWLYPQGMEVLRTHPFCYGVTPYVQFFLVIFAVHFILNFSGAAISASVARRLFGDNPTPMSDFTAVLKEWKKITGFVFLISIVIFLMDLLNKKSWLQRIIGEAVEIAVNIGCFFVVPIIMLEDRKPVDAIRLSVRMLRDSWGEQIVGNVSFQLVLIFMLLPVLVPVVFTIMAGYMQNPNFAHTPINDIFSPFTQSVFGIYSAFALVLYATATEIFRTVLYFYVRDGKVPDGFDAISLRQAFKPAEAQD